MTIYQFKLPDLGEGIVESEINAWHIKTGDQVEEDQVIAEVLTDKAIVEVGSPVSGTVISIACDAGQVLAVGSELACFRISDSNQSTEQIADKQTFDNDTQIIQNLSIEAKIETHTVNTENFNDSKRTLSNLNEVLTSPSIRRKAREANVELNSVTGSGPGGRVQLTDLETYIDHQHKAGNVALNKIRDGVNVIDIKGIRRIIAKKMQDTKRHIPHFSYIEEVDVTELEILRQHLNAHRPTEAPKLTLLPFIIQALVKALPLYPQCNATYDEEKGKLSQYEAVHAGVATMTDEGLKVPVLKHCESLNLWQCAAALKELSNGARKGMASKDQMSGSSITITSLGALGGLATTPIINAPETAIIGINKIQERVIVKNNTMVIRKMMNLSSSFDHRIVDGVDAAQLIQSLKQLMEHPATLFIQSH